MQAECCTCVMVAVGGAVAAALAIADPLKPEARGVVAALAQRGLAVHLVTGDNWCAPRQQGLGCLHQGLGRMCHMHQPRSFAC